MAEPIASLIVNLIANTSELVTGVNTANQKLDSMGDVATNLAKKLGAMFTIDKIIGWTMAALDAADALQAMSERTKISAEALQVWERMAGKSGTSLDAMTRAATEFGKRLAGGDDSASGAVRLLGFSVDELLAMRPEDRFATIAEAAGRIENPADLARIATDLFGKVGIEMLPLLTEHFRKVEQAVRDTANIIKNDGVKALADLNAAYNDLSSDIQSEFMKAILGAAQAVSGFATAVKLAATDPLQLAELLLKVGPAGLLMATGLDKGREAAAAAGAEMKMMASHTEGATTTTISHADIVAAKLKSLTDDYYKPLSAEVAAQIVELKKYGTSNSEIVDLLGVTESQIKRVTDAHKSSTEAVEKATKAYDALMSTIANERGQAQMDDMAASMKRNAENARGEWQMNQDAYTAAEQAKEEATKALATEVEQIDQDYRKWLESLNTVPPALDAATGSVTRMSISLDQAIPKIVNWIEVYSKAGIIQTSFMPGGNGPGDTQAQTLAGLNTRPPGFGGGVKNFSGGLAMVGERGPELVHLPRGASVIPNGGFGGTTINNTFHVNGTGDDVGRAAMAYITRSMKDGRQF